MLRAKPPQSSYMQVKVSCLCNYRRVNIALDALHMPECKNYVCENPMINVKLVVRKFYVLCSFFL